MPPTAADDRLSEFRPLGSRRLLHRLATTVFFGRPRTVDLDKHHVRVDGHRLVSVSEHVARDLLGAPFTSPDEQARTLQALVRHARPDGGRYQVPVIRTRFLGPTTIAPLCIARLADSDDWVAYWWYED
ncbi:MAG TPA: hypothetical protein VFG15_03405 [Amycolatopsis sp.]|nr:hypothetical protein [Amycolatopsis sp.]